MHDAIVISDIHLGSDNCQARQLVTFLHLIHQGEIRTRRLILNGDVFDSIDFRRLKKQHWKILSLLRKLSDDIEIIWINGNHDGPSEIVSNLLGVTVRDEIIIASGDQRILLLHGHRFDQFIDRYPLTTALADAMYRLLQRLDKSHTIARHAKHNSKMFLRCTQQIEDGAVAYAEKLGCDAVCCGHTHFPVANRTGAVHYFNSGCWTERPCHYLSILGGQVELCQFAEVAEEVEVEFAQELIPAVS